MKNKKEQLNNPTPLPSSHKLSRTLARTRVAIAMSGGVDSSVAAKMLVDQGYDVVGFMMKLWSDTTCTLTCPRENACCDDQGVMDAKKVADQLGIPFYLLNVKELFKKEIVDYFIEEYKNLRTPNPCVKCNEKIKFGWLLDFAQSVDCDYLATGHYARITDSEGISNSKFLISNQFQNSNDLNIKNSDLNKNLHLLCGSDDKKDQSYFLYNLNQGQLSKILFPVGEFNKEEVRAMAKKWHLPVFEKRESQEICFIQDKDFRGFLKRNIPAKYFKSGEIVDKNGNILGQHEGLINYTIGQRKGINQISNYSNYSNCSKQIPKAKSQTEINSDCHSEPRLVEGEESERSFASYTQDDKMPLYVIGFNQKKNQLIVGEDKEVYKNKMVIDGLSWINPRAEGLELRVKDLKVKIRYRHPAVDCKIVGSRQLAVSRKTANCKLQTADNQIVVQFNEPQRAITPGQSAVFYDGDEVLGGGIIN